MAPEHAGGAPQTETGTQPSGAAPVFRQPRAPFLDVLGKLSQQRTVVLGIAGVIVFFAVWQVAHYVTPEEKQRFLPSVELVVGEIVHLFAEKNFIADVGTSLYRIYVSFFAASLIAVPLGVLMGCFVKLRALISPTTGGWRYLPAASFAPLLLVWFGPSDFAKMALLFLGCFFFLVALILDNTLAVQRELIESGLTMGASGQLDLVTSTIEFGPIALAEDMPVKLLGLTNLGNGSDRIIVGPDIASPEDLKGKQVGVIEGGLSQIYMAIWLEQQGIKWNEVEMVNLFPDAAAAAMIAGQLSAAELWDPYGPQVLEELPGSREMSHSGEEYWLKEGLIADAIFASDAFIEEHRDLLVALTKARYEAVEWWRQNPVEGNALIAEVLQWGVADVEPILGGENNPDDGTLYMYSLEESAQFCGVAEGEPPFSQRNGQITDHWELTNTWWVTFGLMTETVDPAMGIDCSIIKDALGG